MKNVIIPELCSNSVTLEEIITNPSKYLVLAYIDGDLLGFIERRSEGWVFRVTSDQDEYTDYYDSLFDLVVELKDGNPNLILKVNE